MKHSGNDKDETLATFEQEIAAFEVLMPVLLKQYPEQYAAIYRGEVVAAGDDKLGVSRRVREQYGPVVCFVELVAPEAPRTVRIPSAWVAR